MSKVFTQELADEIKAYIDRQVGKTLVRIEIMPERPGRTDAHLEIELQGDWIVSDES